jgi:hypothetical protein
MTGYQRREDDRVDHVRAELDPLERGSPHDRQGDGAEDKLEEQERGRADRRDVEQRELARRLGGQRAHVQEEAVRAGDLAGAAERERESDRPVADRGDREVRQDLHHPETGVLRAREADLEEQEPGLHEHDEHGGDDHPDRVQARDRVLEGRPVLRERRSGDEQQCSERHGGRQDDTSHLAQPPWASFKPRYARSGGRSLARCRRFGRGISPRCRGTLYLGAPNWPACAMRGRLTAMVTANLPTMTSTGAGAASLPAFAARRPGGAGRRPQRRSCRPRRSSRGSLRRRPSSGRKLSGSMRARRSEPSHVAPFRWRGVVSPAATAAAITPTTARTPAAGIKRFMSSYALGSPAGPAAGAPRGRRQARCGLVSAVNATAWPSRMVHTPSALSPVSTPLPLPRPRSENRTWTRWSPRSRISCNQMR